MTIQTVADFVGASAKVQLFPTQGKRARRIFITSIGAALARFGDVNVTAGQGVQLPLNQLFVFEASDADLTDFIDLTTIYAYIPTGTTLTVAVGV